MKKDPALVKILEMQNKVDPSCVTAVTKALDRLIPMVEPDSDTSARASVDARTNSRAAPDVTAVLLIHYTNIYNFETLQSIANELNIQEENQRSRDGTKQILLHSRNLRNKKLKYQIFDLANRVTAYSNLPANLRKRVIEVASTVLFYNDGYCAVCEISIQAQLHLTGAN